MLFPESGITKAEYVAFYRDVASWALPHLRGRPISLERFPDGVGGERFYQKEIPAFFPDYFRRVAIEHEGDEPKPYGVIDNAASLVYTANLATVIHTWTSCADHLRRPDRIIWDMDPMNVGFDRVRAAARLFKYILDELGLKAYLMTTGSRGLHVVAAIEREYDTDVVFEFSRDAAELAASKLPQLFTTVFTKSRRGKRVFVDYLRNRFAQTAVAPYVVRPIEGGPVSFPIRWDELEDDDFDARHYTLRNALEKLGRDGDAWEEMHAHRDRLSPASEKLSEFRQRQGNVRPDES